jgi:hypothetical protein
MVGLPPFNRGTCRALVRALGPHVVVSYRCRKFIAMPALDVPYDPCPFVCKDCGERGEIRDRAEGPAGYAEVPQTASFASPKKRWKATR